MKTDEMIELREKASTLVTTPAGFQWHITIYDLNRVTHVEQACISRSWQPVGYNAEAPAPAASMPAPAPATNGNGSPPTCQKHKKPMKESQFGGWYCPRRLGSGFCDQTA